MGFTRSPKLKPEIEAQLKEELHPLWLAGYKAADIAERLRFGDPDTNYAKLKPYHVYFYRLKFNFRRRRNPPRSKGQRRYKVKQNETMPYEVFVETLNAKVAEDLDPSYRQRKRAFLILLFWTPLRTTELTDRLRKDFSIKRGLLKIDLYRKKKFYRPGDKTEPFYLRLEYPLVAEVVDWIFGKDNGKDRFLPNERPFNFTRWTAWNYVREVFESYYCHFFRFDYITKAVDDSTDPGKLITDLLRDTGLDLETVTTYIMDNERYRTALNDRQLELLKQRGTIK